jgi:hypothetical protein
MRRRLSARTLLENTAVIAGLVLLALLIANLISFATTRDRLPPETRIGDIDVSGLTADEAISRTATTLQGPITLRFLDQQSELTPAGVGFRVNDAVARVQIDALLARQQGLAQLPAFILRQHISRTALGVPYQYSDTRLTAALSDLARRINREPSPPAPDTSAGRVVPGQDGAALNQSEAAQAILAALSSSQSRVVDLPIDVIPLGAASVKSLEPAIAERLKEFTSRQGNVAGVFIKDLRSGEELAVNPDVAFSARGWLFVPVVVEALRANEDPITGTLGAQMATLSTTGDVRLADTLLRELGTGDGQRGTDAVNALLGRLGLHNTFLAQPYEQAATPPTIITPANARGDITTGPDPTAQSTVADIGVLLEMLAQCRDGTGGIGPALDGQITPEECGGALDLLSQGRTPGLIQASSAGAIAAHRQSWDARNHGDAALVRTPGGEYVIAIQLHSQDALNWSDTSPLISDVARLTYGFFNGAMPPEASPLTSPPTP